MTEQRQPSRRAPTDHPLYDDQQRREQYSASWRNRFLSSRPMGDANGVVLIGLLIVCAIFMSSHWF